MRKWMEEFRSDFRIIRATLGGGLFGILGAMSLVGICILPPICMVMALLWMFHSAGWLR